MLTRARITIIIPAGSRLDAQIQIMVLNQPPNYFALNAQKINVMVFQKMAYV